MYSSGVCVQWLMEKASKEAKAKQKAAKAKQKAAKANVKASKGKASGPSLQRHSGASLLQRRLISQRFSQSQRVDLSVLRAEHPGWPAHFAPLLFTTPPADQSPLVLNLWLDCGGMAGEANLPWWWWWWWLW